MERLPLTTRVFRSDVWMPQVTQHSGGRAGMCMVWLERAKRCGREDLSHKDIAS